MGSKDHRVLLHFIMTSFNLNYPLKAPSLHIVMLGVRGSNIWLWRGTQFSPQQVVIDFMYSEKFGRVRSKLWYYLWFTNFINIQLRKIKHELRKKKPYKIYFSSSGFRRSHVKHGNSSIVDPPCENIYTSWGLGNEDKSTWRTLQQLQQREKQKKEDWPTLPTPFALSIFNGGV